METDSDKIMILPDQMQEYFLVILRRRGFSDARAAECAAIFTGNSIDGIYTHGVNRFPRFIKYIQDGYIKPEAVPSLQHQFGAIEQWNGNLGPGPLNAIHATNAAMRLASEHGMGCVALSNTNHWMRGGSYGWQAAKAGYIFIGWTNTIANMPAWGALEARVGNNPLVIALPYNGEAIVLDMAMSQYSLGTLEMAAARNEKMAVPAGFDNEGNMSVEPASILLSRRVMPAGYWKGSGMALLLDLLAAVLTGGKATHEISKMRIEYGLSQVFTVFDPSRLANFSSIEMTVKAIIDDYHLSSYPPGASPVSFPGERVMKTRNRNNREGIPVMKKVWDIISSIYDGSADLSTIPYV